MSIEKQLQSVANRSPRGERAEPDATRDVPAAKVLAIHLRWWFGCLRALAPLVWLSLCVVIFVALWRYLDIGGKGWLPNVERVSTESFRKSPRAIGAMMIWGAAVLCLYVAIAWNLMAAIRAILEGLARTSCALKLGFLVGVLLVSIVEAALLCRGVDVAGSAVQNLMSAVYRVSGSVHPLVTAGNILAVITVTTIAFACCVLTYVGANVTVENMARVVSAFSLLLYSASVLLLIGLLEIFSLFEWAAALQVQGAVVVKQDLPIYILANSAALGAGVVGSLLLAVLFVPVAVAVQRSINALTADASQDARLAVGNDAAPTAHFDPAAWLRPRGVGALPLNLVRSYAAILLPLAGGLVPVIAKHVL